MSCKGGIIILSNSLYGFYLIEFTNKKVHPTFGGVVCLLVGVVLALAHQGRLIGSTRICFFV